MGNEEIIREYEELVEASLVGGGSQESIEKLYQRLVESTLAKGMRAQARERRKDDRAEPSERRKDPRFTVEGKRLSSDVLTEFTVLDLSKSGLALYSNQPIEPGEKITISMADALTIHAEVVRCHMDEAPTEYLDAQFRIQCKFSDEYKGMELVIKTRKFN